MLARSKNIEKHIVISLMLFVLYTIYHSFLHKEQIATIKENPVMVFGKISRVSQHTNAVVVHFEYSYRGVKYSNQETFVYTDYINTQKTGPTYILLKADQPQISRLILDQVEFENHKHVFLFQKEYS